ncbi:unnamed protein product [Callosobruchus maculatus]|uniref:Uncharacterized protein n=1 Tax=Callosobruchus maculatus TaxID=64391 RepID=A0A653DHS6_CALMS|nr:unnamed protein product [Callosobruchus maculatus]
MSLGIAKMLLMIKKEHNYAAAWVEVLSMQSDKIKVENDQEIPKQELTEITEEVIIKNETDYNIFRDEISEINRPHDGPIFTPTADITNIEKLVKVEEIDLEMFMDKEHYEDIDAAQLSDGHTSTNTNPDLLLESTYRQSV